MTMENLNGWIERIKELDREYEEANYLGFIQRKIKLKGVKSGYELVQSAIKLHFDNMEADTKEAAVMVLEYLKDTLNSW